MAWPMTPARTVPPAPTCPLRRSWSTKDKNAAYLIDVLDGWNLDEVLTRDTAAQLCDELPGAATEIMEAYRLAIVEGRLGN